MNILLITGFFISLTSLILMVLLKIYGRTKIHRIWFLMNLVVFVWGLGCFFIGKSTSPAESYLWWRIAVVGGLFIAPFFYHTTCIFAMVRQPVRLVASYIQASLFAILSLFTDVTLNKLRLLSGVAYYPTGNLMFFIMFLCWTTVILFGTKVLINLLKKSTGKLHLQTKYLIIAFLTGFIGGGATLFPVFDLPYSFIYPFGNFGVALYSIIGTYAILRHKLMDISLVVQKGIVSGCALDVFEQEPPKNSAFIGMDNAIVTPHLGASTEEAQVNVALEIACQVADVLEGKGIRNAVNFPCVEGEVCKAIDPYIRLAEKLGRR